MAAALEFLGSLSESEPVVSSFYTSAPVDCPPGSEEFVNAVAEIDSGDGVRYLLTRFKAYEAERGRDLGGARNAPRPIDLDILYAGSMEMQLVDLIVPHPRLPERLFVLEPLAEIRSGLVLPGFQETVEELLSRARIGYPEQQCRKIESP